MEFRSVIGADLAQMTRFSALSPLIAQIVAACLAAALALSIFAFPSAQPQPEKTVSALGSDADLYSGIASKVRDGQPYYDVVAYNHRAQGYPLKPVMAVRLPTLAWISGALGPMGTQALMLCLIALTLLVWLRKLRSRFGFPVTSAALFAMTLSLIPLTYTPLPLFHESWGGLMIALALGLWRKGAPWASVVVALIAALLRETTLPLIPMMGLFATISKRRSEAIAWTCALCIWGAVYALHSSAVTGVVRPDDLASPGWSGMGGWPMFVAAVIKTTPLSLLPATVAGPLIVLALFGWASLRGGLGLRVTGWLFGMATMIMLFARPDNFYWAVLPASLLLAGLAFVPKALAELWTAARAAVRSQETQLQ